MKVSPIQFFFIFSPRVTTKKKDIERKGNKGGLNKGGLAVKLIVENGACHFFIKKKRNMDKSASTKWHIQKIKGAKSNITFRF